MFADLIDKPGCRTKSGAPLIGAIFDSLREMIIYVDGDLRIVWGNKALLSYTGKSQKAISGMKCKDIVCKTKGYCPDCPLIKAKASGQQETATIHTGDGERIFFVRSYPVESNRQMPTGGFVEIILDITEETRRAQELENQRMKIMQAEKLEAFATIISSVAHEVNNPLSFMTLNLPLLSECWKDAIPALDSYFEQHGTLNLARFDYPSMRDEIPKLCDDILVGAKRLKAVISDLKDYVIDGLDDKEAELDINSIITRSLTLTESLLRKSSKNLKVELDASLPKIKTNPQRLAQALVNLLINASHEMKGDTPSMKLSSRFVSDASSILISIEYEGECDAGAALGKPFNAFAFGKLEEGKLLGLDISLSKRLLESISGSLEVKVPSPGHTSFTISFPVKRSP